MSSWWSFHRPFLFVPQFYGPSIFGQEFGLVVDGDEFCVRLAESVGRKNLDTVLADRFSQRL